jgi:spermidine/putrescine transport system permease protein
MASPARPGRLLLTAPALAVIVAFMLLPLLLMAYISILEKGAAGGVRWGAHTFAPYIAFLFERDLADNLVLNTDYLRIFLRSFWLAGLTTLITLLIGFPTALGMALAPPRWRTFLIFLVTVPFWANLLVRNYAWIILLRNNGLVDQARHAVGLGTGPLDVLYTPTAVLIGLVYSYLPFMVLPIFASLEKLDWRLVEAALDLGARRWHALRRIVVPLAMPGIVAGSILVFIPGLGAFITPELLGGGKALMIGNLIQSQFGAARNWPFGAALSFALLALVLLAMLAYLLRYRAPPGAER